MSELNLDQFDRAAAAFDAMLTKTEPASFDSPSRCGDWSVKQLANHVVHGTKLFAGIVTGSGPVDGSADHLGSDAAGSYRAAVAKLRAALSADGVADRVFATPVGERTAERLVVTRIVEMSLHGWDLARATGQTINLDDDVVDTAFTALKAILPADRTGMPFGPEQPASAEAAPADRLAAFGGRAID